jgi:hypothetical protein
MYIQDTASIRADKKSSIDYACSRYDHAYPYLIHHDSRLGDPTIRTFQFKSCSGALTADVVNDQIPKIDSNQQIILLSAGKRSLPRIIGRMSLQHN